MNQPSSNPETPAPDLPPGYALRETPDDLCEDSSSWFMVVDPDGRDVDDWPERVQAANIAWAHYGRAAWAAQREKAEGDATPDGPESLDSQASRSGEQPLSLHGSDRAGSTISEEGAGSGEQSRPSAPATPTAPAGPRVSDDKLAKMRLATAFIDPPSAQDDIIAVIDDLWDARRLLAARPAPTVGAGGSPSEAGR